MRGDAENRFALDAVIEGRFEDALNLTRRALGLISSIDVWAEAKQTECDALEGIARQNAENSENGRIGISDAQRVRAAYSSLERNAKKGTLPTLPGNFQQEEAWRIKADIEQKRFDSEVGIREGAYLLSQFKTATMTNNEQEIRVRQIIEKLEETLKLCPIVGEYFKVSKRLEDYSELRTSIPVKQKILDIAEIYLKAAGIRKEICEIYKSDPAKQRTLNVAEREIVDSFLLAYKIADGIPDYSVRSKAIAKFFEAAGTDLINYVNNVVTTLANDNPSSALDYVDAALNLEELPRAAREDLKNKRKCLRLRRKCPECRKAWGLRYTGNTENRANRWIAWLLKKEYHECRCEHCGYEEWR